MFITNLRPHIPFLFSSLLLYSCSHKQQADLVIYHAKVYTVDKSFSMAEAFAIKDGKILKAGTTADILNSYASKEKIDANGKPIYPGFIDAHCHFFGYASDMMKFDLYGTKSFDDVVARVVTFSKTNKFSWILGRGWDQNDWTVKQYPAKDTLDKL